MKMQTSSKQRTERGQAFRWPKQVLIYTDGASRGNPGPSSAGFVVYEGFNSKIFVYETAFLLGTQTNNFAEYSAVLEALKMSARNRVQSLIIKSDSELLVKQLTGLYKVKSPSLKKLNKECQKWIRALSQIQFQHIPREQNKRADALANLILDGKTL